MKHKIKKFSDWNAGCSRLGCIASLQGGIVEEMSLKDLDSFFQSECPYFTQGKDMSYEERVNYLIKYAKKEIKGWQKSIDYWSKHEKQ